MKQAIKHLNLPSGLQAGLPMLIDAHWSTEQVVAVTELLEDLLEVIHGRYQVELYTYWRDNMITKYDVDDNDEGVF